MGVWGGGSGGGGGKERREWGGGAAGQAGSNTATRMFALIPSSAVLLPFFHFSLVAGWLRRSAGGVCGQCVCWGGMCGGIEDHAHASPRPPSPSVHTAVALTSPAAFAPPAGQAVPAPSRAARPRAVLLSFYPLQLGQQREIRRALSSRVICSSVYPLCRCPSIHFSCDAALLSTSALLLSFYPIQPCCCASIRFRRVAFLPARRKLCCCPSSRRVLSVPPTCVCFCPTYLLWSCPSRLRVLLPHIRVILSRLPAWRGRRSTPRTGSASVGSAPGTPAPRPPARTHTRMQERAHARAHAHKHARTKDSPHAIPYGNEIRLCGVVETGDHGYWGRGTTGSGTGDQVQRV